VTERRARRLLARDLMVGWVLFTFLPLERHEVTFGLWSRKRRKNIEISKVKEDEVIRPKKKEQKRLSAGRSDKLSETL
jgi:hypothetical protein